jgi:hypothetical protein
MSKRIKPKKVHGRELEEVRDKGPDGRIVYHHRTVDTLGMMLKGGTISPEMHDAAKDFQADFIVTNLDAFRALPLLRVPGTGREPELNERQLDARRRVYAALEALGGISSPAGSCVWHVVGLQWSVRDWAMSQGWRGRPVDQKEAKGILVAALAILARHYGYHEERRASEVNGGSKCWRLPERPERKTMTLNARDVTQARSRISRSGGLVATRRAAMMVGAMRGPDGAGAGR